MTTFLTSNGKPVGWKLADLKKATAKYPQAKVEVSEYKELQDISYRMIKWWKGILLPALSDCTGDSKAYWEGKLKLEVDPDYFAPFNIVVDGIAFNCIPSIAGMPMQRAIDLVDNSVAYLRDETKDHKDMFKWVTLPDETKRRT